MSNCVCSFIKGLWAVFMGSLRMILFLGVIGMLVASLASLMTLLRASREGNLDVLPKSSLQMKVFALNGSTLLISIIGLYSSFCSHHVTLRSFSFLTVGNSILMMLVMSNVSIERENDEYFSLLKSYMPQYDWNSQQEFPVINSTEPTRTWDHLQTAMCCGLDGPKDWDALRPQNVSSNLYPSSCCSHRHKIHPQPVAPNPPQLYADFWEEPKSRELCPDDVHLYRTSCKEVVIFIENFLVTMAVFTIIFQFILAILASCIACESRCREERRQEVAHTIIYTNHQQHMPSAGIIIKETNNISRPAEEFLYPNLHAHEQPRRHYPDMGRYGSME